MPFTVAQINRLDPILRAYFRTGNDTDSLVCWILQYAERTRRANTHDWLPSMSRCGVCGISVQTYFQSIEGVACSRQYSLPFEAP